MTSRHEEARRPTWTVQSVFDPDGEGREFAYTIGLDELGLPELHLWGRPSLGEDPGEDWMFSPDDRCRILNELAWGVIDRTISVGTELVRTYDDGAAVVRFEVGPPGDIEELEAYGVAPGATVLPVRWSLTRPPDGRPRTLKGHHLAEARTLYRQVLTSLGPEHDVPPGWELQARPSWRREQRWGPLTPVVLARAAQLWQADAESVSLLVGNAVDVREASSLTWPASLANAAARQAGRRKEVRRLYDDVPDLVDHVVDAPGSRRRWAELMEIVWGADDGGPDKARRAHAAVRSLLHDVTAACLMVEAVADVVDTATLTHARGPWIAALSPTDDLPPGNWASGHVLDALRDLIAPLSLTQLGELAHLHALAREGEYADDYPLLAMRLRGWALTGPAGCPWRATIGRHAEWTEHAVLAARFLGRAAAPHHDLRDWTSVVSSALTHRCRLSAEDVDALAAPVRHLLPGLGALLNQPL
ncbi:hypothetical protein [Nocardioides rubriscoriae]|uniref:hypothetical protein n=1 Tax=Nocardioides rubriscoriae TaxID=642762 RepID=UPI001479461D|nr:hypothetical protein [Nocardioides rubriscoriae]